MNKWLKAIELLKCLPKEIYFYYYGLNDYKLISNRWNNIF